MVRDEKIDKNDFNILKDLDYKNIEQINIVLNMEDIKNINDEDIDNMLFIKELIIDYIIKAYFYIRIKEKLESNLINLDEREFGKILNTNFNYILNDKPLRVRIDLILSDYIDSYSDINLKSFIEKELIEIEKYIDGIIELNLYLLNNKKHITTIIENKLKKDINNFKKVTFFIKDKELLYKDINQNTFLYKNIKEDLGIDISYDYIDNIEIDNKKEKALFKYAYFILCMKSLLNIKELKIEDKRLEDIVDMQLNKFHKDV